MGGIVDETGRIVKTVRDVVVAATEQWEYYVVTLVRGMLQRRGTLAANTRDIQGKEEEEQEEEKEVHTLQNTVDHQTDDLVFQMRGGTAASTTKKVYTREQGQLTRGRKPSRN